MTRVGWQSKEAVTCHGSLIHSPYLWEAALKLSVLAGFSIYLLIHNWVCYFENKICKSEKKKVQSPNTSI